MRLELGINHPHHVSRIIGRATAATRGLCHEYSGVCFNAYSIVYTSIFGVSFSCDHSNLYTTVLTFAAALVCLCVCACFRADEANHRVVNHTFADMHKDFKDDAVKLCLFCFVFFVFFFHFFLYRAFMFFFSFVATRNQRREQQHQ